MLRLRDTQPVVDTLRRRRIRFHHAAVDDMIIVRRTYKVRRT